MSLKKVYHCDGWSCTVGTSDFSPFIIPLSRGSSVHQYGPLVHILKMSIRYPVFGHYVELTFPNASF